MTTYDQETARAWAVIMDKVRELRKEGKTLEAIGKPMNVKRATVSRWLNDEIGGERTTFGDMLRYAKGLDIDLRQLTNCSEFTSTAVSPNDKALGKTLEEFTRDAEISITELTSRTQISLVDIEAIFSGKKAMSAYQFHSLCKAIEINTNIVFNRSLKS